MSSVLIILILSASARICVAESYCTSENNVLEEIGELDFRLVKIENQIRDHAAKG